VLRAHPGHLFYRVTWSGSKSHKLKLYGNLDSLARRFPSLEPELVFEPGQTHRVPLSSDGASHIASLRHFQITEDDGLTDEEERTMLAELSAREKAIRSAEWNLYHYLEPDSDYYRAALVGRLLTVERLAADDISSLADFGMMPSETCDQLRAWATQISELRQQLEDEGWTFKGPEEIDEPPDRGRPVRFPGSLIRALYRSAATREDYRGCGEEILTYIQEKLPPVFGRVSIERIRRATKYEARKLEKSQESITETVDKSPPQIP